MEERRGCRLSTLTRREGHSRWLILALPRPLTPSLGEILFSRLSRNSSLAAGWVVGVGFFLTTYPIIIFLLLHHHNHPQHNPSGQDNSGKVEMGNSR